jgi:uncharacterized YigZ family protein
MLLSYTTISDGRETELKEKGSSFIAKAFPVASVEAFSAILTGLKKEYYDATHHCYAVRLADGYEKYSDDGEPNGTAGVRIMNAIVSRELHNIGIIVIRYFGGTKLGVGPLGVAYSESALSVIDVVQLLTRQAFLPIEVVAGFEQTSAVYHLFSQFSVKIIDTVFADRVTYKIRLLAPEKEKFLQKLDDALRGKYELKINDGVEYL